MIFGQLRLLRSVVPGPPVDPRRTALRAGDERVLAEVIEELLPKIHRWAFAQLGPRADLEDATQDALVEVSKALRRYDGRASIATFARRVTLRVCYRYYHRRDREETSLELVPTPADLLDPESHAVSREALRRLYQCLDALPQKRRAAFVLCAVEGLTAVEAAGIAGCRPGAMRARLMTARAELEEMLRGDAVIDVLLRGGDA
ncbi:MAG: sigma-70 family RNA polymerase sigma factor [Deltaproteobacteria bacterium]|nr:sigma-70 family RNA polymerase sigma factor [Deltaproteobacteria bacterium]